jgi:hypothetical protein
MRAPIDYGYAADSPTRLLQAAAGAAAAVVPAELDLLITPATSSGSVAGCS